MARLILLATACLAIVSGTSAEEAPPKVLVPPRLYVVSRIDQNKGEIVATCQTVRFMWQPTRIPIYETAVVDLPLASTDCFDVQGKKVTAEEIYKRLAVGAVIAVSADTCAVDPVFL